jgi:hypothetical protein
MNRGLWRTAVLLSVVALVGLSSGCAYMENRGDDLLDILDMGFTAHGDLEPNFVTYAHVVPLAGAGIGRLRGGMFGLGSREAGVMHVAQDCYGIGVWGMEAVGIGKTADAAYGVAQPYSNGILRLLMEPEADIPPFKQWLDVEGSVHLGWIGFHARVKPYETLDFVVGLLTTLDIADDDIYPSAAAEPKSDTGAQKAPEATKTAP